jgi:hypothetical protein
MFKAEWRKVMSCTITVNEEYPIVEVRFTSTTRPVEFIESTLKMLALAEQENITMAICDCSEFFSNLNVLDLLEHTRKRAAEKYAYNVKLAVLMSARIPLNANAHFWENICCNHALKVKVFNDQDEAVNWLHSGRVAVGVMERDV